MTAPPVFEAALAEAQAWHAALPEARAFCPWPDDMTWAGRKPHALPATRHITQTPGATTAQSSAFLTAIQALIPHADWRHGYTAAQVGQDFLDRFCWCELAGPQGHFHSNQIRLTLAYWGPNLFYPRHHHAAEELYTVVSGEALFHADGTPVATLGPGQTRLHLTQQPHAMTTQDSAVLTCVFWRGGDLAEMPSLSA